MTNMFSFQLTIVCKKHYIDCQIKEIGINNTLGNPTYTLSTPTKQEILENHKSVLISFGVNPKDEDQDLPSLYWIPKLHKNTYKERYIEGSSKCSTNPFLKFVLPYLLQLKKDFRNIPKRHIQEVC